MAKTILPDRLADIEALHAGIGHDDERGSARY
jgi:hypothetical protein